MFVLIEAPFWQQEWHGIQFSTLSTPMSSAALASSNFYSVFYDAFFEKYSSFADLDAGWRRIKSETAAKLAELLPPSAKVLSYGCGLGYVEYVLGQLRIDLHLSGYDFSNHWVDMLNKETHSIRQVGKVAPNEYDVIYLVQVLYALPFSEGVALLISMRSSLREGGRIILFNTSVTPAENGILANEAPELLAKIKDIVRPAYFRLLSLLGLNNKQFWGWHRNNASYTKMLRDAGFEIDAISSSAQQSFIVAHPN